MFDSLIETVRSRSKREWKEQLLERWTNLRIWLQENGEMAFVGGLALGFFCVVFFRLVALFVAVGVLVVFVISQIAPDGDDRDSSETEKSELPEDTPS